MKKKIWEPKDGEIFLMRSKDGVARVLTYDRYSDMMKDAKGRLWFVNPRQLYTIPEGKPVLEENK